MELARIQIGKKEYPYRIDLTVIEQIEERFSTVEIFEQELLGWRFKRDRDGRYIRKADGDIAINFVKPSTKALIFILPRMVNRGLKLEALERGVEYTPVNADLLIAECEMERFEIRKIVADELKRCFGTKKDMPGTENRKNPSR